MFNSRQLKNKALSKTFQTTIPGNVSHVELRRKIANIIYDENV